MSKQVVRLFKTFQPEHYNLYIDPDRDTMKVSGTVVINGKKVGRPSQRLTFHQHGLRITAAKIIKKDRKGNQELAVTRINHHARYDEVRLHTEAQVYPGQYEVHLTYEGVITKPMDGIYPCFFTHDGKQKKLIATQFESHHARDAFPCIDEPEAKATFDLTLVSPAGEVAIANTPVKAQKTERDKLVTTFETTPVMSTYLLAFAYGEMGYKEAVTKRGIVVRAYATPDNVKHMDFGVEFMAKCLDFYEEYFDIPYPLAKCDWVALPDFSSGAMENWGLITSREQSMVFDPANSSLPMKQYVAMVIAHELTHQWFGNLVTMRWWTDLWLNEGFATWMSYMPLDKFFPDWKVWTQFAVDEQQPAFKADSLANTHAVQVPISDPEEINSIFDNISYEKGASSIHMLHRFLGPEMFRRGLSYYLKQYAYKNTDTVDLWKALEAVSGKPVTEFMSAWIELPGYPLVQAHISEEGIHLSQEQFLVNPLERGKDALVRPLWPIALEAENDLPELFDQPEADYPAHKGDRPIKLNRGQQSFFRAAYNASHLERLAAEVMHGHLGPEDRLGLLADTFEAAKAGYSDTTSALHLLESYRQEQDNAVWDIISANIGSLRNVMDDEDLREDMKPYIRQIVASQLRRLGWEDVDGESYFDKLLRPTILAMAAVADETSVVDEALRRFKTMEKPEDLPPDLRGIIYTTAARHGDAETFDKLWSLYKSTTSAEEHVTLSAALTAFKQPELIKRSLDLIISDDVRMQDAIYWIIYSFTNRFARRASWEWLQSHWKWLTENMGRDLSFARMPVYVARSFSDPTFLKEYKTFFGSVMSPMFERSYKQGIEMIEWQTEWKRRDLKLIKAFFAQKA